MKIKSKPAEATAEPTRKRRRRTRLDGGRRRLYVDEQYLERDKYHYAWINDEDGDVQRKLDLGYEFCSRKDYGGIGDVDVHHGNTDTGSNVSIVSGLSASGQPLRIFFMRQPMEFFLEDQEAYNSEVDRVANAINRSAEDSGVENAYGKGAQLSRR